MSMTFDDMFAPLGADAFLGEYLGKKPLHLEGAATKFADVMNWATLNRLLGMSTIWASESLMLVLDKEQLPASAYCSIAPGRDGGNVMRPDSAKVRSYLKQGATLVANDIDQLTPQMNALCHEMEEALGGKVQANLYLSSKRKQGFKVHFDTHDVFAVHVEGEKVWHVFEGRAQDPIAHPMFKTLSQEHHEEAKGELWREVRLKPGDILYLPRGQYHYALAEDGGCVHIALGVTYPIGVDAISLLFERMIAEPLCRANLPQDKDALAQHLRAIGSRTSEILGDPETLAAMVAHAKSFRYPRQTFDLPALLDDRDLAYRVTADGVRLVEQSGRFGLVKAGSRQAVEVPADSAPMVRWVLSRQHFAKQDLQGAFKNQPSAALEKLIGDLRGMALIRLAA